MHCSSSAMSIHGNKMIPIFVDCVLHLIVSIRFFWQCVDCRLKTARTSSNDNKRFCGPDIL